MRAFLSGLMSTSFKIKLGLTLFLVCFAGIGTAVNGLIVRDLPKENAFLETELTLTAKAAVYLIMDLPERKIQLKAKGFSLKELPIETVRFWGDAVPIKPFTLIYKQSFDKPERVVVKPGEMLQKDTFKIDALELEDMPDHYSLRLSDNVIINVTESTTGFWSSTVASASRLLSSWIRSLWTVFYQVQGLSYTVIDLQLEKKDAQTLYWAFTEGMETIMLAP